MSTQFVFNNSSLPSPFSQGYSSNPPGTCPSLAFPCPSPCIDPKDPAVWDYGFKRIITFWQSPPFGASILAITFFFFIAFSSNALLELANPVNLGIIVTLGTLGLLALVILILFLL